MVSMRPLGVFALEKKSPGSLHPLIAESQQVMHAAPPRPSRRAHTHTRSGRLSCHSTCDVFCHWLHRHLCISPTHTLITTITTHLIDFSIASHRISYRIVSHGMAGSEDSTVKLWSLPDGGLANQNMGAGDAAADLTFSYTAIRRVSGPAALPNPAARRFDIFVP